jgi:uncharacterized protein YggE
MKTKLFAIFALCVLAAGVSAQTVDVDKLPTIKVTGTAEIFVVPDTATFSFTVSKKNNSVAAAKKENDETVAKITDLAKRFNIPAADVKTDYIRVSEVTKRVRIPNSNNDYETVPDGYRVSRSMVIKLRDMSRFESFLTALIEAGVTDVSNVSFSSSELRKYKDQARREAIRAAREKAQAIVGEIGQLIGRAVSIEEKNIDGNRSLYANTTANFASVGDDDDDDTVTAAIGTIAVKAQVEVEFLLN